MSENLKNKTRGKISAMKLFSDVDTVTQAAFNLEPDNKAGYACNSDGMIPRRKTVSRSEKALYFGS